MTSHSPDERLSAFYDGELSAVERAEVERLVSDQPGLRAELSTLTGLSQQLSDLADDLPEIDLRPRVMQRIADSRPATLRSDVPARRRWMPLALLVCSLALLVAAVLPMLPLSNQTDLVTDNGQPTPTISDLAKSMKEAAGNLPTDHPGESVPALDSPLAASPSPPVGAAPGVAMMAAVASVENIDGTGPSELLARLERRRDLKPGDIFSQLIEGGDVPMIAEYTVIDVRRSARDVEFLLEKHRIVPLLASDRRENSESTGSDKHQLANPMASEMLKVYLVDAESISLNTAMIECENLHEVVALNYEPLGLNADGAQLAALNNPSVQAADAAPAVAGSPSPAPFAAAAQNAEAPSERLNGGEVNAKGGPIARKQMPHGPQLLNAPLIQSDQKMKNITSNQDKAATLVNGNSIVIDNGDEFYSEVKQHQVRAFRNNDRGYSAKQQLNTAPPTLTSRNAPATQALEAISNQNSVQQFGGQFGNNGNSLNNAYNGGRSRQRAILVLRSQSPPPPPEATRINP